MLRHFRSDDGARLAFRDEGEGLPLLALAGLTRNGSDFDYLAPHLTGCRLIRLDARGRGGSDWTGWESYTLPREARDVLALLDHLGLDRAGIIGASRGGLLGMALAATAKERLAGLCLVDVGPLLERQGLERIGAYLGQPPEARTLDEVADLLPRVRPGFSDVPAARWEEEAAHLYAQLDGRVGLTYDPALRRAVEAAMAAPAPDLWPLFDACAALPLALIRGAGSDVLAPETADDMQRRRLDMIRVDVPGRGHVPFLDEPQALAAVFHWIETIREGRAAPGPLA
jgi:pimeloyl-ACP methyl ester carboxylesterase